ncbi:hypothetical protein ACFOWU_11265 [Epilithonimonas zeae]|uniref:Uncharacterized protein n=1 Tax=Epilithonimonas zeae TaxID=1416779 RepID=A0A1N6HAW1_9FLAO|nr:hypothetical protein [Epilithonimonas zeae]SIO16809.1 hypothetical protein SAMN05444409_2353 [Epilithonimonas zeae]
MMKHIVKIFQNLPLEKQERLIENNLARIYGSQEIAGERIKQIKETADSDNDFEQLLINELNVDFLMKLAEPLIKPVNITEIISGLKKLSEIDLQSFITNEDNLHNFFNIDEKDEQKIIDENFTILFNVNLKKMTNDEKKIFLIKKFTVNKDDITEEFGINKRTLNKWLIYFFKDKYKGKRKIYLDEYLEIFSTFITSENEDLFEDFEIEKIYTRLKKGHSFYKSDIAFLLESDLKTQRENVKQVLLYNFMDKFPYRIMKEITDKMGGEIDF